MYFYLIGSDYKRVPIDIRDNFYRIRRKISDFCADFSNGQTAVFFTCNRIEIYAAVKDYNEAVWQIGEFGRNFPQFYSYAYVKYNEQEVFRHILRVACGLESQIKGETQILAQLNKWRLKGNLPLALKNLLDEIMPLSEKIRFQSGLNKGVDNVASVVFYDLKRHISASRRLEVAVIGTGKVAELIGKYRPDNVHLNFIAHKNFIKAQLLAKESAGRAFLLKDLPQVVAYVDVIISSTFSPHYVIRNEDFLKARRLSKQPLYIYDLALPSDVEPSVKNIHGIFLQNTDDLEEVFIEFNLHNQERIDLASDFLEKILARRTGGCPIIRIGGVF